MRKIFLSFANVQKNLSLVDLGWVIATAGILK